MAFLKAASTAEVPPGSARQVSINGKTIALFNVAGKVFALDDCCPHRGAPLSEGSVSSTEVTCPWHGARFDLPTGNHLCPPAQNRVACYPVQVVGDEIQVEVA